MCAQNKLLLGGEKCLRVISGREFFYYSNTRRLLKRNMLVFTYFSIFACMALGVF